MNTKSITITRVNGDSFSPPVQDRIVDESPLQILLVYGDSDNRRTENLSVTMRTKGDDLNLVTGFLFCEGIIRSVEDILSVKQTEENTVVVGLSPDIVFDPGERRRNFIASSACGFCGKSMNDMTSKPVSRVNGGSQTLASALFKLPALLCSSQGLFSETGGAHAVALATTEGVIVHISEDVGRHNAMDKMIGAMLAKKAIPLLDKMVLFSGRMSYELVQKAVAAGIPILCAIGAPTTLAIELAEKNDLTVIGFLKNQSFNIYCGAQRIIQS